MEESDQPSLTEFLLDLTESDELYEKFGEDPHPLISARGLQLYQELLLSGDVQGLRDAVRAEVTRRQRDKAPPSNGEDEDEEIIRGIRIFGIRTPPPPPPPPH
jgi:hypothetical protein